MKAAASGRAAEALVAVHLEGLGYKIRTRNWRTKLCEIDIVAEKNGVIYFYEVKFRASESQGGGLDYITERKIRQLKFAAANWCDQHSWTGDYRVAGASVSASPLGPIVDELVEIDY
jgi:Holliday junction resolvase-like predicted endonuclease